MGILQSKSKSGSTFSVTWGFVNSEPKVNETSKGCVSHFFLAYDREMNSSGKPSAITISCEAWGAQAEYCKLLEKGDYVLVFGKIQSNNYNGKEGFKLVVDMIVPQAAIFSSNNSGNMPAEEFGSGEYSDDDGEHFA